MRTPIWNTGKKVVQRVETERAAESTIENLRNRRVAILVAELDVVFAGFPRNAVDVMPVGVYALPWVSVIRTKWRKASYADFRQAEIVLVGIGRSRDNCVQTDRRRIEATVLRKKPFSEAVPAEPSLVDNGRRNRRNVGE